MMRARLWSCFAQIVALLTTAGAFAQGTAFTYQGLLASGGLPANGNYDFCFSLYDAPSNGTLIAGPTTNLGTLVSNGVFITAIDFNTVFSGSNYWLDIAVRSNGGAIFTELTPRQALTSAPYSVRSRAASQADVATVASAVASNAVNATNIAAGQVVKSINGLTDVVTIAPGTNISLVSTNNTLLLNLSANFQPTSNAITNIQAGAGLSGSTNGATVTLASTVDQVVGLSSNLVSPGATYDSHGYYALPGFTVGNVYLWHQGSTNDNPDARDGFLNYGGGQLGRNGTVFVAGSNTMYLQSSFPPTVGHGSNIYSRIYAINTNHVGGFFEGVFYGQLAADMLPIMQNQGVMLTNGNTYIFDGGSGLNIIGVGHGVTGNSAVFRTLDPLGYSGFALHDSADNEYCAIAKSAHVGTYNDAYFPYDTPFWESYLAQYSIFFVGAGQVFGGVVATNRLMDWTWFDSGVTSYEAATNYSHVISQSRQEDNTFYAQNLAVGNAAVFTNAPTFAHTNTPPTDPATPKLWIDVTNNGAVYKMPLFQ